MRDFKDSLNRIGGWLPIGGYRKITTIDAHTGGEPLRVIIGGFPELPGDSIPERRRFAKEKYDDLRTTLMWEPRGHADMYGCILTPPVTPDADFGVLFLHNEGFSTMCGHGIIAVTKVVLETGMLEMKSPETVIRIDTPAGLVTAYASIKSNGVSSVHFHNVPSFVLALDEEVEVPEIGRVRYDLAFGGAFYAFVKAQDVNVEMTAANYRELIEKGMLIKHTVMNNREIIHPIDKDLSFLYGTIFTGPALTPEADSRNVCIFAEGEVDRSPTGTGVSARMAIHYARGDIGINDPMIIESIIGSRFTGKVIETTRFGSHDAVIPEVEGTAFITGKHEFLIDPADPLKDGFILR